MDRTTSRVRVIVIGAAAALALCGCFERTLRPVTPCTRSRAGANIQIRTVEDVDLLFMIDNSNSMSQEQAQLAAELPRLVEVLASGDRGLDGTQDFQPVRSLHIGVITSDMGVGDHDVPTCDGGTFGARFGDDGVLITRGRAATSGCMATYPAIFDFQRDRDDPEAFAFDVACVATTGTGGCGFEQQLEAVLKALSPSLPTEWTVPGYVPPVFVEGTSGHADRANAGFVRRGSALAVILVTDEEDCSASNPDVFNPGSSTFGGTELNLRCFSHPDAVHPIQRFIRGVDGHGGLLGLRQDPSLLIFAGIVGVPVESVPDPRVIDYDAILAHPDMREVIDPETPTQLRPSCDVPGVGTAFPPRRIVGVAQGIEQAGGSAVIQSICQSSYEGALDAIIAKIADALRGACLPRDLNPDAQGFVQCQVFEVLPATGDTTTCAGLPGRDQDGIQTIEVDGELREMCEVIQVGPAGAGTLDGWWYETAEAPGPLSDIEMACPAGGQRIAFTGISPVTGSSIRLECVQTVLAGSGTAASIGSFCDPADGSVGLGVTCQDDGRSPTGVALACDAADRTCGVACDSTATCTSAGLLGDVCDHRSWLEAVGATEQGISDAERARRMTAIPAGVAPEAAHGSA